MKSEIKQNIQNFLIVGILLASAFILATYFLQIYHDLTHQELKLAPAKAKIDLPKDLDKWYSIYNSEYFGDKLPKDTVIDWSEYDPNRMSSTSVLPDGRFHIAFSEKYCLADRTAHIVLLHEDCHIATFSEITRDPKSEHGPRWRTCMLNLYQQGAFKKDLIDGIE